MLDKIKKVYINNSGAVNVEEDMSFNQGDKNMENYIFDYSICSLFYLGILLYFFIHQKHLLTIRTRIYKVALN